MICYHVRMIVSRIHEVARKRGIENANQLSVQLEIPPRAAWRLWRGEFDKIGVGNLDKLCAGLDCSPCELLAYVPEGAPADGKAGKTTSKRRAKS